MAPTASTATASPEAENLLKKVSEQGEVVRNLKTSSAAKVKEALILINFFRKLRSL